MLSLAPLAILFSYLSTLLGYLVLAAEVTVAIVFTHLEDSIFSLV